MSEQQNQNPFVIRDKEEGGSAGMPEGIYPATVKFVNPTEAEYEEFEIKGRYRDYAKQQIGDSILTRILLVFELDDIDSLQQGEILLDNAFEVTLNGSVKVVNGLGDILFIPGVFPEILQMENQDEKSKFIKALSANPEKIKETEELIAKRLPAAVEEMKRNAIAKGKKSGNFDVSWHRALRRGEESVIDLFLKLINFRAIMKDLTADQRLVGVKMALEAFKLDLDALYEGDFEALRKVAEASAEKNQIKVFTYMKPYEKDGQTRYLATVLTSSFAYFTTSDQVFANSLIKPYGERFPNLPAPNKIAGLERFTQAKTSGDYTAFEPHMFDPRTIAKAPTETDSDVSDLDDDMPF